MTNKNEQRKVPELRFPEFSGEWEEKKLNEISDRVTRKNKNLISTMPLTISAKYGLVDQVSYFNKSVSGSNLENYYLIKNGEFAYNKSYSKGYPFGAIKRLNNYKQGILSTLYICFKPNKFIDTDFLEKYFDSTKWHREVSAIAVEGARNHGLLNIPVNEFFNVRLHLPNTLQEQQKIGEFFSKLDQQIELEEKKLALLEEQKKGYMQKIFSQELRFKDEDGEEYPEWIKLSFTDFIDSLPTKQYQILTEEIQNTGKYEVIDQGKNEIAGYSDRNDKLFFDFKDLIIFGDHTTIIKYRDTPFIIGGDGVKLLTSKYIIKYIYSLMKSNPIPQEGYKRHYSILKNNKYCVSINISEQEKMGNSIIKLATYGVL
ncbi:restriction endonuclease subunit S [Macrococcoides bohemicum]|uniref:restriction endonuclease subunit S n=1 Tax=Macrococcoides bohemicum TaxID=1903056 RepID=UPI00193F659A|nr:restriction endonuclease subunit S [Macrococcus bohemicus]QRN49114.1 restriction endonuclease subunit S [Macrococcus bohemicus]